MPEIRVVIDTQGNASIDAIGFSGNACEVATQPLEEALGTEVERTEKPERQQEELIVQTL